MTLEMPFKDNADRTLPGARLEPGTIDGARRRCIAALAEWVKG